MSNVTRNPKTLRTDFFVRTSLDQDRVMMFAELMSGGTKFPPIIINGQDQVVDGRHRKEAYELLDQTEIPVEVRKDLKDPEDIISEAYKANCGGALPPSREDTEHTIRLLLEHKVSKRKIGERLGLPPSIAKKYVDQVELRENRAKLHRATTAMADEGLSAQAAADRYGIDVERIKEHLRGNKKKKSEFGEISRQLTVNAKSHSSKVAATMRKLTDMFADGDCTERQIRETIEHLDQLNTKASKVLRGWSKRFESIFEAKKLSKSSSRAN